jgi:hypothetical protein
MLLSDDLANRQGFLSRLLVCAPASTQGHRFQREPQPWARPAIEEYTSTILKLLEMPPRMLGNNELDPRKLRLSDAATKAWREFADEMERRLGFDAVPPGVRGLCNKIPELALRLAGVLAMFENPGEAEIGLEVFNRVTILARYHLGEAARLYEAVITSPEIARAEKLLRWLVSHGHDRTTIRDIQNYGPSALRERKLILEALAILQQHGWVRQETQKNGHRTSPVCILSPFAKAEILQR